MTADLRRRPLPSQEDMPAPKLTAGFDTSNIDSDDIAHPSGREKKSRATQNVRRISLVVYFLSCCIAINITQFIGAPLYWINRDLYYAYMALTKESFGLLITTMTKIWGPTTIRISGDQSVAGQIHRTPDGRVEFDFPDRMVMIANHQASLQSLQRRFLVSRMVALMRLCRFTPTGCTSGGLATQTTPRCMDISTSFSKSPSSTYPS